MSVLDGAAESTASVVIAVAGAKRFPDAMCYVEKARGLAHVQASSGRQIVADDLQDASRSRAHHHDPVGQEHRLRNRVRDEHNGLPGLLPKPQQLFVQMVARNL